MPTQLRDVVLVPPQLRHRPRIGQFLHVVHPREAPLFLVPASQRLRHRSFLPQFPLLPEQQRHARRQQQPERYPDAEAHGEGLVAFRRRDGGGGRGGGVGGGCAAGGDGGRCRGLRSGGGGGRVGVREADAFLRAAGELAVAEEDTEGGEGEVGGALAGAFAFPHAD